MKGFAAPSHGADRWTGTHTGKSAVVLLRQPEPTIAAGYIDQRRRAHLN